MIDREVLNQAPPMPGVVRVLHRKPRATPVRVTEEIRAVIAKMHARKFPKVRIARAAGISYTSVLRIIKGEQ